MKMRVLTVVAMLVASAVIVRSVGHGQPVTLHRPFWQFPNQLSAWTGQDVRFSPSVEDRVGVSSYMYRVFRRQSSTSIPPLDLYVGFYESQKHGEMIHSPKNCLPGSGWFIAERDTMSLDVPPYQPFEVNKYVIANGTERQVVLYWYQQAGGRVVTNEYLGRVHMVMDALTKNRTDAALIRVIIPTRDNLPESVEASTAEAVEFLRAAYPELMRFLPHERPLRGPDVAGNP